VPIFGDDVNEDEYIERILPDGGEELWQRSVDESPYWESMSPEQHMEAADLFAGAVFGGNIGEAEDFTDMLGIMWDDADISDFWDLYDALSG
jgi:hypothetical protein